MSYKNDTLLITGIKSTVNDFLCTNDTDRDAMVNEEYSLRTVAGEFTSNGTPDFDLDGVADSTDKCKSTYGFLVNLGCPSSYFYTKNELNVFIGLQLQSLDISLPELNTLGYVDQNGIDAIDVLQSKTGFLNNPGRLSAIYAGGGFTYYFGQKRRQAGIIIGIACSSHV